MNLLIVLCLGYLKWRRGKTRFNFLPVYISLVLVAVVVSFKVFTSDAFKGRVMIVASATETDSARFVELHLGYLGYKLILRYNNSYQITGLLPEASCTYGGKFSLDHDTVDLQESFLLMSDTNLSKRYVIDRKTNCLRPVDPATNKTSHNKWWFGIIEINSP
ncbi:MAG: hypothetical protein NT040_02080 [Bacteroidetes bacterium]|nr:hypothetical protein [Bacteroidota bacterium]